MFIYNNPYYYPYDLDTFTFLFTYIFYNFMNTLEFVGMLFISFKLINDIYTLQYSRSIILITLLYLLIRNIIKKYNIYKEIHNLN